MSKWILNVTMLLMCSNVFGQKAKTTEIPVLRYEELSEATRRTKYPIYIASNGERFQLYQWITLGQPSYNKTYTYINMATSSGQRSVSAQYAGQKFEIKGIVVEGSKESGFIAYLICKPEKLSFNYLIQIENALASGELVSSIMSSDQALEALKKAKDKLDLGLITQEEFDKVKEELRGLIK
jgi:hypothetical protein